MLYRQLTEIVSQILQDDEAQATISPKYISAISRLLVSNSPSILGLVTIIPAVSSSIASATDCTLRIPFGPDLIGTGL